MKWFKIILALLTLNLISQGGFAEDSTEHFNSAGKIAIDYGFKENTSFKLDYHITDNWILVPGFGFSDSAKEDSVLGKSLDAPESEAHYSLGLLYLVPIKQNVFIGVGPNLSAHNQISTNRSISSNTVYTTKSSANWNTVAIKVRPQYMVNPQFGIYGLLSLYYRTDKQTDSVTNTGSNSSTSSKSARTSTGLESNFGIAWYL